MRRLGLSVVFFLAGATSVAAQAATESPFAAHKGDWGTIAAIQVASTPAFGLATQDKASVKTQSSGIRFLKLLVPVTAGALAGSAAGFKAGNAAGLGGTKSDGLQSAVLLGTTGGMLGAAAGSYLVLRKDITPTELLHGVSIGALGGILGGAMTGNSSGNWGGREVWLGFSLGQGLVTSFVLSQVVDG